MSRAWVRAAWVALAVLAPRTAGAQEFASAAPALASPAAARLLEHALPDAAGAPTLALLHAGWYGLPELATRAVAAAGGIGPLRFGAGASQTGDGDTGWTALGLAAGWAEPGGGVALRAIARRDRLDGFAFDPAARAWGLEAGAGGWLALDASWRVWVSAPSLWSDGPAPPLARPLGWGVAWEGDGARAWLAHAAPPGWAGAAGGGIGGGAALRLGPAWLWLAGRDHPARPAMGLELAARGVRVVAGAESHPVLGTSTRLALALGGARAEAP